MAYLDDKTKIKQAISKTNEQKFGIKQEIKIKKVHVNNLPQDLSSFRTVFPRSLTEINQIYSFKQVPLQLLKTFVEKNFKEDFELINYFLCDTDNFNRKIEWKYTLTKGGKVVASLGLTQDQGINGETWVHFGVATRYYESIFGKRNIIVEVMEL